jgi:hypothetical protein
MNFMTPELPLQPTRSISSSFSLPVRILLGVAGIVIFVEFLVLWQFMQPVGLVLGEATHAPRPATEREGVLKRF